MGALVTGIDDLEDTGDKDGGVEEGVEGVEDPMGRLFILF